MFLVTAEGYVWEMLPECLLTRDPSQVEPLRKNLPVRCIPSEGQRLLKRASPPSSLPTLGLEITLSIAEMSQQE